MSALDPSYIRSIRDDIINGNIEANNQEALPAGLVGLYDKELFPPTMKWRVRKETLYFFLVFAIAQKEISADFASAILGDEWFNLHNDDESKEEKRLQKVNDLIQLHSKRFSSVGGGKYRLYHERFRVYVLQKVSQQDITQFNDKFIALCETALETISEKEIPEKESYALEFISTHFFIGAMQDETECLNVEKATALKQYAYDQQFWERQIKASKGFEWSKRMLNEMMALASKFNEDDEVIECALNKVDLYHLEQNDAPRIVQLVADGDIEIALERIEKFGGEDKEGLQRKFILYMLCLMELTLLESKDKDHAKSSIEKLLKHLDEQLPIDHSVLNWNDFFSSYLVFQMSCKWAELGLNYLILFKRTKKWDNFWIKEKGPYTILQLDILKQCIKVINSVIDRSTYINSIALELTNQNMINDAYEFILGQEHFVQDTISVIIATELIKTGKLTEAINYAQSNNSNYTKSKMLEVIAYELQNEGFSTEAVALLDEAKNYFSISLNNIRDLLDKADKVDGLIYIASELELFGKTNEAEKLLEEAFKSALEIDFTYKKLKAILSLTIAMHNLGRIEQSVLYIQHALDFIGEINDKYFKCLAFKDISNKLFHIGRVKEAEYILQESIKCSLEFADMDIIDDWKKSSVLNSVAEELFKQRKILQAEKLIQHAIDCSKNIIEDWERSYAFHSIVKNLALQDKIEIAIECANYIDDKYYKCLSLHIIQKKLLGLSRLQESDVIFQESIECFLAIDEITRRNIILRDFLSGLFENGNIEKSVLFLRSTLKNKLGLKTYLDKSISLHSTSVKLANNSKRESAIFLMKATYKFASNIGDILDKHSVIKTIVIELTKIDEVEEALNYIQNESFHLKSENYIAISDELIKKGKMADAINVMQKALECVNRIIKDWKMRGEKIENLPSHYFYIFQNIANQLSKLGNVNEAVETAHLISDKYIKSMTIKSISVNLAKYDNLELVNQLLIEAIEYAFDISNDNKKNEAVKFIAIEFANKKMVEKALEYIRLLNADSSKIKALHAISAKLSEEGDFEKSQSLTNESYTCIQQINDKHEKSLALLYLGIEIAKQEGIFKAEPILDEAYECANSIDSEYSKIIAIREIAIEFIKLNKIKESLNCVHTIRLTATFQSLTNKQFKQRAPKEIAIISICDIAKEFTKINKHSFAENILVGLPEIAVRQKCWKEMARIILETQDYNLAIETLYQYSNQEANTYIRKGIIEAISMKNLNKNIVLDIFKYPLIEFDDIEKIIQYYAMDQLFFTDLPQEKLDRYNRTLNLQWAIDIKNQLPN